MNILVIVFSFLAILALNMTSFWKMTSAIHLETTSVCGYLNANRQAENSLQRKLFKKLPDTNMASGSQAAHETRTDRRSSFYRSPRLKQRPHPYARLQLSSLWGKTAHPFVENIFRRLLDELYGHLPWYVEASQTGDVDALVANIIRFGKSSEGEFELHDLFFALPSKEAKLLYKMMKGTHLYALEGKSGCPPLLDFVSFGSESIKQTCRFSFASLPLLHALFDADTVSEIMTLEKKKWEKDHRLHTCTKAELLAMLQYRPSSPTQSPAIDTYFYFGKRAGSQERIFGQDEPSGIHVERSLKTTVAAPARSSAKEGLL